MSVKGEYNSSTEKLMRSIAAFAFAMTMAVSPCKAQMIIQAHSVQALTFCRDESRLYSVESADKPAALEASFAKRGNDLIFRTCSDYEGNVHYFIRKPRPNRSGVCRVFEDEIFPGKKADGVLVDVLYDGTADNWYFELPGWKSFPPEKWTLMHYQPQSAVLAQVHDGSCPRGDNTDYIPISNVTDGTLTTFDHLWKKITSSPDVFAKAIADVPLRFGAKNTVRENFRSAVFDQHERPQEITCAGSSEDSTTNAGGCRAIVGYFAMEFDVSDSGLSITGLYQLSIT